MIAVLPMHRYGEPELAGLVEIWACRRRSSFQRRPSRRSLVRGYVVDVSRGIFAVYWGVFGSIRSREVVREEILLPAVSRRFRDLVNSEEVDLRRVRYRI